MSNTVEGTIMSEAPSTHNLKRFHFRIVFTAGTGFFTDAYDLFIIGIVTALLTPLWHLTTSQLAVLNGASLAAAAVGAVFFGTLADKFGRAKMYGFEILVLFFGAILSALSPNFWWLLASRIIVGLGIGGDYPSSAVVTSEFANNKNRGFLVLLVFAMQAIGLMVGPMLAGLLLMLHIDVEKTWRILLGIGAIPAASVFYLRRSLQETPQYLLAKISSYEVSRAVSELTGHSDEIYQLNNPKQRLTDRKWFKYLIGTAGAWFLLDVAFYGNGISSVLILKSLSPNGNVLDHTLLSALLFLVFAVPGYFLAAKTVDSIGRKTLQNLGFGMIAICYALIAFIPGITNNLTLFILIFGISFFFVNFGPNTTTFLIPAEIYPASIRAKGHGISAAIGKIGAFVGAICVPIMLEHVGLKVTLGFMSIISACGILTTMLVPEMKRKDLAETENQ